jgi:hypothetical protein
VANQALNITREGQIWSLGVAFEVGRKCADDYEHYGLFHGCNFGETTFFDRIEDIQKLPCSLVVIGVILSLPLRRIMINRIGTTDLGHLFGVTRYGTRGNNHSDIIMHCLVKTNIATQLCQKWVMVLRWKHHLSLGPAAGDC